jgi:hypothetical protein
MRRTVYRGFCYVTTVDRDFLFGSWRLDADENVNSFFFGPSGDVVHTFMHPGGMGRIALVWRLEGDVLTTEEPASGRTTQTVLALDGDKLDFGGMAKYRRESEAEPFDPLARQYTFAASALRYGFAQIPGGAPFEPFLIVQGEKREVQRFHYPTPEEAGQAAHQAARSLPNDVLLVAWVYDGFITAVGNQQRTAALMAIASERGLSEARLFAQPYAAGGKLLGAMAVAGQRPSWL